MAKHKAGLHKEVSTIFDGVPLPKNNGADDTQQQPHAPIPERTGHAIAKPRFPNHQAAPTPKPQQPTQPPPKAAPAKQHKADTPIKTARQIPWRQTLEQIKNKLFASKPGVDATRQKAMAILVPVLAIIMIFILTRVLGTPSQKIIKPTDFGPSNAAAGSNDEIEWQIPDPYPTTLRDPMRIGSARTTQGETGELIVKGIVYSKDNPSAVIGTNIVHEGDRILNVTVVKINKSSVEFEMNNKRWIQQVQR